MRLRMGELTLQLLVLLPVSFVSAAAVSYFVPRAGAVDVEKSAEAHTHTKLDKGTELYNERIVTSQWEKQRRWTLVYKERRDELLRARVAKLTLISLGAVAQVAVTQVPTKWKGTTSFAGGCLVAMGGWIKKQWIKDDDVEKMVTSFYIAQAIKSEVVKYRTKCAPYNKSKNDALEALRDNCSTISKSGNDKRFFTMQKDKKPIYPDMATKDAYIERRVNPRINSFLIGRANEMQRKAKFCSGVEDVLIGAGTIIGLSSTQNLPVALKKIMDGLTGWAGAFTTISTAFANHLAKMKYEEISEQYYDTASQLREMVDLWPLNCNKAGDPGWDAQIEKMENLIVGTTEEFARKRTGNKDLHFNRPVSGKEKFAAKVWNPNVVCGDDETGSYPAIDRAKFLVEHQKMDMAAAKKQVMDEFPDNF